MKLVEQGALAAPASRLKPFAEQPLVSIISFCKNRASTVRRSIESVLSQSYRNIEFVVQDGASTDGTLEILRSYRDDRIKLVSESDSGPAEAFWKVLNRCRGDIIGTCLSDEELLPGAIEKAVELFRGNPELGAVTCDGYITDPRGKVTGEFLAGEFNLVDYLFGPYCPFWPGTFLRRQALIDVGLEYHEWTTGSLEFEIWCRLGTQHNIKHFPIFMSKYAVDADQLSNTPKSWNEHLDNRVRVVEQMFSENGFVGAADVKKIACLYNQHYLFYNHARAYKVFDQMEAIYHRMESLDGRLSTLEQTEYWVNFTVPESDQALLRGKVLLIWGWVAAKVPRRVRKAMPAAAKKWLREESMRLLIWLFSYVFPPRLYFKRKRRLMEEEKSRHMEEEKSRHEIQSKILGLSVPPVPETLYVDFANLYYARGQIGQALAMWERAQALNDPQVDGIAAQAMLLLPGATHDGLLGIQRHWAARHVATVSPEWRHTWVPYHGDRKIRIGYHCSFMDGDTIRFIMSGVIKRHDRERFTVCGYSLNGVDPDIGDAFDAMRITRGLSDEQFADLVRSDEIDIFVEMSGFSPYHRFGAMALRCAPIQISYLNHSGTSGVPNVDYILADEVSVSPEEDRFYTEKVWRLPGAFLCYNYDMVDLPPVVEPPCKSNGYVTFGCFGSGGKINDDLIAMWAEILKRVPGSRIYLRNYQLTSKDNCQFMLARFRRHGIGAERVRLESGAPHDEILRSYDNMDISLDTWPYCGGNTVAEALWQGVPVVTLKGGRFSSRYGASLLLAAGCAEFVGETVERYIEIAVQLANAPERLDRYRKNLRSMAREFGLSDVDRFARKLDDAYVSMMHEHEWDNQPVAKAELRVDRLGVSGELI